MSSIFDGVDMDNPCEVWPVLQTVCNRLLAGEMRIRGRFDNDDQEWQPSDVKQLRIQIRDLKLECTRKTTGRSGRRAITFG